MDPGPNKKRIAQLLRLLGSTGGEQKAAWKALERTMRGEGISWSDIGNMVEHGVDEGRYSEAEMQEFAQAMRAEGIEAGIKIGRNGGGNRAGNSAGTLPPAAVMAEYCHQRLGRLKSDWQREFVANLFGITRRTANLSPGRLGNLAKIYIEIGGKI